MANFHIIETGYFYADGGAMFGPIPKKYWSKRYPCNDNNMCTMAMRCVLIEADNRLVLVDCGGGDKHIDKLKFYQPHDLKDLRKEIKKVGFSAEDVTDVVLTHLHFDHCGGGTVSDKNGNVVPAFPSATYWLSEAQWNNYRNPLQYEVASFFPDNIEPIFEAGQLELIKTDMLLTDDIMLKLYDGHTPGQIVVFFNKDNEQVIFPGDVVPTSVHLPLGWLSAYDNNAALAMEEKKRFLEEAKAKRATLIFFHDAYLATKQIEE